MKVFIVVVTKQGKIIKFDSKEVHQQTRGGCGIRAIVVAHDDNVVAAFAVPAEDNEK